MILMKSQKKLESKLYKSNITPPSRFLLLEKLLASLNVFLFHFTQFLSSFLKYSFSNFSLSYPYNIFAIYFSSNSPLLKFFSSTLSSFPCLLTSVLIFPSNSTTNSFAFSKSSSLSQLSCSAVNLFYHTKYFTTPLTFCLFNILSTFYSSILWDALDMNNFYFLFLLFSDFIGILFSFSFSFLLDNEEACDTAVT